MTPPEPDDDLPAPSWARLRDSATTIVRPPAWRETVLWAIDRLSQELGTIWPETAFGKHGRVPGGLEKLIGGHPHATADWIELALMFTELRAVPGIAKVRRELAGDSREEKLISGRLQMEVATLARARALDQVVLEPQVGTGPRQADVAFDVDGTPVVVETVAVLADQHARAAIAFWNVMAARIQGVTSRHGVRVSGQVGRELAPHEQQALIDALAAICRAVQADQTVRTLERADLDTALTVTTDASELAILGGPPLAMDPTRRLMGRIAEKALQTDGAARVWIRVDARDAVQNTSPWGHGLLRDHAGVLEVQARMMLAEATHVAGVVISTGTRFENHERPDDVVATEGGSFAVCRRLHPFRRRETLVLPIRRDLATSAEARTWTELYATEPEWLPAALARRGLPSLHDSFPGLAPES
jgi:hypothetical protein